MGKDPEMMAANLDEGFASVALLPGLSCLTLNQNGEDYNKSPAHLCAECAWVVTPHSIPRKYLFFSVRRKKNLKNLCSPKIFLSSDCAVMYSQ